MSAVGGASPKVEADLVDVQRREDVLRAELGKLDEKLDALRVQEQMLINLWGLVAVMGRSRLTPAQITAWFESTKIKPNLPDGITIADLAKLYVEEGDLAGVKGDMAFAQSIIETGSFTEFKGNNFSGIGMPCRCGTRWAAGTGRPTRATRARSCACTPGCWPTPREFERSAAQPAKTGDSALVDEPGLDALPADLVAGGHDDA